MKMSQEEFDNLLQRIRDNDPSLSEVNLSWNNLKEVEAKSLAESLEKNRTVTNISLSCNHRSCRNPESIFCLRE